MDGSLVLLHAASAKSERVAGSGVNFPRNLNQLIELAIGPHSTDFEKIGVVYTVQQLVESGQFSPIFVGLCELHGDDVLVESSDFVEKLKIETVQKSSLVADCLIA